MATREDWASFGLRNKFQVTEDEDGLLFAPPPNSAASKASGYPTTIGVRHAKTTTTSTTSFSHHKEFR